MKYFSHILTLLFSLVFTLVLSGCSSVPFTTMMYFSNAQPQDFFQVDPQGIKVKVTINSEANFDPVASVNLAATIDEHAKTRQFTFPLTLVSVTKQGAKSGLFANTPAVDIFILKLSEQAIQNLALINQQRMLAQDKKGSLSAGVNFTKGVNVIDEHTRLSIALKLADDSFITLVDNWRIQGDE